MVKIYLAGGMKNLTYEEYSQRRYKIKEWLYRLSTKKLYVFNPSEYYNYQMDSIESEKEVFRFELRNVKSSDVVLVDFIDPNSIGTSIEVAVAYENNIPIIGINDKNNDIHAWHKEMCDRIFDSIESAAQYVIDYYVD